MRGRAGQIVGQGFSGKKTQLGLKMSKAVKDVGCSNLKTMIEVSIRFYSRIMRSFLNLQHSSIRETHLRFKGPDVTMTLQCVWSYMHG